MRRCDGEGKEKLGGKFSENQCELDLSPWLLPESKEIINASLGSWQLAQCEDGECYMMVGGEKVQTGQLDMRTVT